MPDQNGCLTPEERDAIFNNEVKQAPTPPPMPSDPMQAANYIFDHQA